MGAEKPNPAIFSAACELLGVQQSEVVHVGDDRRNDIWGARDAGCDASMWGEDVTSFQQVFHHKKTQFLHAFVHSHTSVHARVHAQCYCFIVWSMLAHTYACHSHHLVGEIGLSDSLFFVEIVLAGGRENRSACDTSKEVVIT